MPLRMSAVVLNSRCIKSRSDRARSRGGFQHLPNNFSACASTHLASSRDFVVAAPRSVLTELAS